MFVREVDDSLMLALVEPGFAARYMEIVDAEREYLGRWLAWPHNAHNREFFMSFITNALQGYSAGQSLTCGILYQGELVGNVSLNKIDRQLSKTDIGYWLSEQCQGQGLVTRVVSELLHIAFDELKLEKVEIAAAVENLASRKVAQRLGFTLEGVIRRAENIDGRVVDHAVYGLLAEEWRSSSV